MERIRTVVPANNVGIALPQTTTPRPGPKEMKSKLTFSLSAEKCLKLNILEYFAKLEKMKNEGGIGSDMCYYSL